MGFPITVVYNIVALIIHMQIIFIDIHIVILYTTHARYIKLELKYSRV